jgi:hypothetical protein
VCDTKKYFSRRQRLSRLLFIQGDGFERHSTGLPGGNSEREPPDPIPNSEVKTLCADGSVGSPHVRVGHRQALDSKAAARECRGFFIVPRRGRCSYGSTRVDLRQSLAVDFFDGRFERVAETVSGAQCRYQ